MKSKTSLICFALLFSLLMILKPDGGFTQEKKVYTLEESIGEALSKNPTLKAKEEKVIQATHVKKQARADFLPKFSTSYGYTRLNEVSRKSAYSYPTYDFANAPIGYTFVPEYDLNTQDNYQWKGTVKQPLFTGFALTSSYRLAELGIDKSEMELELGKMDLALQVKKAYFEILIADKSVEVASKDVEFRKSNVRVARSFFKVGMIPINDVLKAEVMLANAQLNLITARNASYLARSVFNTVLARPVNAPTDVVDILIYKPEHGGFQEYVREALKNRPEMKLLDVNILQIEQQIRLAKSKNYPEIGFQYDYIKEGDKPDVSGSPYHDGNRWQAIAVASWTFWEWGKTYYSVREKESLKNELIKSRLALEDSIRLEVKMELLALKNAEENIPTTRKAVEQGEENLRVNNERYKAQMTTITEVLDAQTLLSMARANYYRALYNHNLAKAGLQRALGTY